MRGFFSFRYSMAVWNGMASKGSSGQTRGVSALKRFSSSNFGVVAMPVNASHPAFAVSLERSGLKTEAITSHAPNAPISPWKAGRFFSHSSTVTFGLAEEPACLPGRDWRIRRVGRDCFRFQSGALQADRKRGMGCVHGHGNYAKIGTAEPFQSRNPARLAR